jgi:hypothetical protein
MQILLSQEKTAAVLLSLTVARMTEAGPQHANNDDTGSR